MLRLGSAVLLSLLISANAFAVGRDLAPRPSGPSAYAQQTPLVASAGGKYLTVWLESLDHAGWRYLGAFSDSEGKRISPSAFVVLPYGLAGPAQLIGTGDSFALFFALDDAVLMMDIDLAGQVTATRTIPMAGFRYDPAVAWNGAHFVVVERTDDEARAVFLDRAGTIARKVDLPCRFTRHELIAVRTDVIMASVCDGGGLRTDRIANDGSITTTMLDAAYTRAGIGVVAASAGDDAALIAWSSPDLDESIKTAIVSADGTMSPPKTVAQGGFGQPLGPLLLAKTTNGFLLPLTVHGNLRVAKLDDAGALIVLNEGPQNSTGWFVNAGSKGTDILVADIHYEGQPSRSRVRTRLVDAGAQIGTPEILSIVPARQLAPAIASGSGTLVGVWTELQGNASTVKAARIGPDGTPLSSAVIATEAKLATDDLAWNGADYLTVILRGGQLLAQRINAFGEPVGQAATLGDFPHSVKPRVSVVWAGNRWVVVWTDSQITFHADVASDGTRSTLQQLSLQGTLPDESVFRGGTHDVALAFDGSRVIVAWIEEHYAVDCRVTCLGSMVAFIATLEDTTPHSIGGTWENFDSLSIATNGGDLVVAANRYSEVFAAAIDSTLTTTASRTFSGLGDVTWDGSAFVLASRERERLTVRRLDASLGDAARARVARIAPSDTENSAPSIAAAFSGNAIVGIQECDASGGRAVAYAEQELEFETEPRRRRSIR